MRMDGDVSKIGFNGRDILFYNTGHVVRSLFVNLYETVVIIQCKEFFNETTNSIWTSNTTKHFISFSKLLI